MRLGAAAAAVAACAVGLALLMAVPRGPPGDSTEDQAVQPVAAPLDEATRAAAPGRVAAALRYETVGDTAAPNHVGDAAPFRALHSFLEREYASVFKRLKHERVSLAGACVVWAVVCCVGWGWGRLLPCRRAAGRQAGHTRSSQTTLTPYRALPTPPLVRR